MKKFFSLLATLLVLALAIWIGRTLWVHYMNTPWTRDGRVRADIINVAADVNGYVVNVPVKDNQLVKKGEVLLEIDPEHYEIVVKQAQSLVASRKATWESQGQRPSPGGHGQPGDLPREPGRCEQYRGLGAG